MTIPFAPKRGLAAVAASAAALATACMPAAAPQAALAGDRQCFLASQVNGFHSVDDDIVHVTVGANDVYALDILGGCPTLDWERKIAIRSHVSSNWVCSGYDAELLVPSPIGVNTCPVTNVRRLSEAEAAAIRAAN